MKKKTKRNRGSVDVNAPLMMIPCYNYGIDDLKAITQESSEEGLSLHSDGHVYFGGTRLSSEQEKASFHLGSELPRFTTMLVIDADKSEMEKVYQIWKALTTLNSYILFNLGNGTVMIAFYSEPGQPMLEEIFHYYEFYLKKKMGIVQNGLESGKLFEIMQTAFDIQLYNEYEGCMMFPHKLRLDERKNLVMPLSVHLGSDRLTHFRFDQVD